MANIVTFSDYVEGSVTLQQDSTTQARLEAIRDEYQDHYIYQLLGAELGTAFLADLDGSGVPQTARFEALYDPFVEDDECEGIQRSLGIKIFIKNIIWFHFARINNVRVTVAGNASHLSENSEQAYNGKYLAHLFNQSIDTGKAIQWYIHQNSADYPEYNGQYLDYVIGI